MGDDSGNPDATTPDGGGSDATTQDVQSSNDAVVDGPTGCAARTADDTAGIFVSKSGADVNSCGTRGNPCLTITYAIATAKAASGKTTIYVAAPQPTDGGIDDAGDAAASAAGVYQESITLDAPITIEGGWNDQAGTWTPICDATTSSAVVIQGVSNTTIATSFSGAATLRDLKVTSKSAADPQESLYGIFATGASTSLTLDQVVVTVGPGGDGVAGTDGIAGASATDAGCAASNGAAGTAGAPGGGGGQGTFSSTGYVPTNGGDGGTGSAGHAGTGGGTGACSSTCEVFTGSCPSSCGFGTATVCGQNGISGCGGAAGTGGSLGSGGGSSVAVYVWDAHVVAFGGQFASGNGGKGANGGAAGDGGAATAGAAGSLANCASGLSGATCVNFPSPHCSGNAGGGSTLAGGSAGGSGGVGGTGGAGGGGSGGDSYAIVQGGDAGVTLNGGPVLAHGAGGTGGVLGGTNGLAADRWP